MNKTTIEYTDYTWNPVTGCFHQCPYCFARRIAERFRQVPGSAAVRTAPKGTPPYKWGFDPTFWGNRLPEPARCRRPSIIFACDMGDLFGSWVPCDWCEAVMSAMREAAHHTFLLLTKAPRNIVPELLPPNLWIGTSVATQLEVGRVDHLVEHGGQRKKWLSFEPLLSAVSWPGGYPIDAVVVGALTRNGRTVPPERGGTSRAWVDRITVQAAAEGIPVFYKSNLLPLFRDDPMPQNPPPWRTE